MRPPALAAIGALLVLGACTTANVDTGAGTRAPQAITMEVVAVRTTADGVDVDLELRNGSPQHFLYTGYSSAEPLFDYQYLTERAWVRPVRVLCGTGLGTVGLGPGERVTVTARVYVPNRLRRLRVGVAALYDEFVVWSPVIDPATLSAGRRDR